MDSAPAGATRMGNRSSTRHGGPALVFMGPVRKWRKVLSPVSTTSPSPSAARTALLKWNPVPPATNGGVKEDSPITDETLARQVRPVKYVPISAVLQRSREEAAVEEAEEIEAEATDTVEMGEAAETTEATEKTEAAETMEVADVVEATRAAEATGISEAAEAGGATGAVDTTGATGARVAEATEPNEKDEVTEAHESGEVTRASETPEASEAPKKEGDMSTQSDPSPGDKKLTLTS